MDASTPSTPKGKRNISRTVILTRVQALEVLQQSILECQKAGIEIQIIPKFFHEGTQYAGIMMANITISDGNLTPIDGKAKEEPDV